MKCLAVIAHPLVDNLCHSLARTVMATLAEAGHEVEVEELCASDFPPALTAAERRSYYGPSFDTACSAPWPSPRWARHG
jgi:putative NADPH-quinone reductase